jgi:hypothetical protein
MVSEAMTIIATTDYGRNGLRFVLTVGMTGKDMAAYRGADDVPPDLICAYGTKMTEQEAAAVFGALITNPPHGWSYRD